jgi:hypothetical protein
MIEIKYLSKNKNYPGLRSSENLKVLILSAQVGLKLRILRRFF